MKDLILSAHLWKFWFLILDTEAILPYLSTRNSEFMQSKTSPESNAVTYCIFLYVLLLRFAQCTSNIIYTYIIYELIN